MGPAGATAYSWENTGVFQACWRLFGGIARQAIKSPSANLRGVIDAPDACCATNFEMRTMKPFRLAVFLASVVLSSTTQMTLAQDLNSTFARDPKQPMDQHYTDQIHKYTTGKAFISPLVDYLPASKTVPTPEKVLGDVSGAPNMLPYAEDVYKYFRQLEAASPRVKVFTIGHYGRGPRDDRGGHCRSGAAAGRQGE